MSSDIQSETAPSIAHEPKYFVVSILPHEAKVVAILPLVRFDWLKWSCDKYDTVLYCVTSSLPHAKR